MKMKQNRSLLFLLLLLNSSFAFSQVNIVGIIINADNAMNDSIAVCVGEEVEFYGYGIANNDTFIDSTSWNFGDDNFGGEDTTVFHSYTSPGQYIVTIWTLDNLNNDTSITLKVNVSPQPSICGFNFNQVECLNDGQYFLSAFPQSYSPSWEPLVYTMANIDCIEDDVGVLQEFPLFVAFNSNQTQVYNDFDDILCINLNIEHSSLSDLTIQIMCPNGTIINLNDTYPSDESTFLGVPVENMIDCEDSTTFGETWSYSFSPFAAQTMNEVANTFETLPSGNYQPVEIFSQLNGCPISGVWMIMITDFQAENDGFISSYSMEFNPSLDGEDLDYYGAIGTGADSSFWNLDGQDIVDVSSTGNTLWIDPQSAGQFDYTYTLVSNLGCTFNATTTVIVQDEECIDPLGLFENEPFLDFELFPNPSDKILFLKNSNFFQVINLYSIDGQKIKEIKFEDNALMKSIDVSSLNNGIYLMEIQSKERVSLVKRFIVQH